MQIGCKCNTYFILSPVPVSRHLESSRKRREEIGAQLPREGLPASHLAKSAALEDPEPDATTRPAATTSKARRAPRLLTARLALQLQ